MWMEEANASDTKHHRSATITVRHGLNLSRVIPRFLLKIILVKRRVVPV